MVKQSLLLVDGDARSLRLLETSLKKAGYEVSSSVNGVDALAKLDLVRPDLVISGTHMVEMDGFEFRRRLKQNPNWAHIPFIFLANQRDAFEDKNHGLELVMNGDLSKSVHLKEILSRVQILLEKRPDRSDHRNETKARTQFHGHLQDMAVVDLIQTIEIGRKSGVIYFEDRSGKHGSIYFRNGKVIDAELNKLCGEEAVYRLLSWTDGEFNVEFKNILRKEAIELSSQGLLMEGMRRLDEWGRLCEEIPPLDSILKVDTHELSEHLSEISDEVKEILKLFDGSHTIMDVVDNCKLGDLGGLNIIAKLFFNGLITRRVSCERVYGQEPQECTPQITCSRARNIIRFSCCGVPIPVAAVQAIAPNPNDLLEAVAGETIHAPHPEPLILAQPTVIIQDQELVSKQLYEVDVPELLPKVSVAYGISAYQTERTTRIEPQLAYPVKLKILQSAAAVVTISVLVWAILVLVDKILYRRLPSIHSVGPNWTIISVPPPQEKPKPMELKEINIQPQQFRRNPPPLLPQQIKFYKELLTQARSAYAHRAYSRARQLTVQARLQKPDAADVMALQALIALEDGQLGRAAELAKQAIVIEPDNADAYLALGTIALGKRRMADARIWFKHYLKLAPQDTHAAEIRAVLKNMR